MPVGVTFVHYTVLSVSKCQSWASAVRTERIYNVCMVFTASYCYEYPQILR